MIPSADGRRLFRSDDACFDHRRLRIPLATTAAEIALTARIDTTVPLVAHASAIARAITYAARARLRAQHERALLGVPRSYTPLPMATAADLYRRARSLSRSSEHALRLSRHKRLSFSDLHRVPLPRPVFDFVWRLVHRKLAFKTWMRTANGVALTNCPDCGLVLDDAQHNDHVTFNCSGGVAMYVAAALEAWLTPALIAYDARHSTAFLSAWKWQLRPSRRNSGTFLAIMLVAIAKHRIWVHFTARVFGAGSDDPFRMARHPLPLTIDMLAVDAIVSHCKSDLRSFLRRGAATRPRLFRQLSAIATTLMV